MFVDRTRYQAVEFRQERHKHFGQVVWCRSDGASEGLDEFGYYKRVAPTELKAIPAGSVGI